MTLADLTPEAFETTVVLGNTLNRWLIAGGVALGIVVLILAVKRIVLRRLQGMFQRRGHDNAQAVVEQLQRLRWWFVLAVGLYGGGLVLLLPDRGRTMLDSVLILVALLQGALLGTAILQQLINNYTRRRLETDAASATTIASLGFLAKVVLWVLVALLAIQNLGVDVTALVAGLGIGGLAIALAAQNILGDLFASLSIVLDKPFVLGDFIVIDQHMGTVEHIGMKTTRLRSLSGEQLIFSNNDLLQSRIRNYKRMQERRILFTLGVTYDTPEDKLARIPEMIADVIRQQPAARFDRAHFKAYGDFSLIFEIVYYMQVPDYMAYMDTQQNINLELFRRFQAEGIEFAFPTQTIYLQPPSPVANS